MRFISQKLKVNFFIKILGFTKIPLMLFCNPKIIEFDDEKVVVKIRLKRKTKNHLGSMYFGALAVGADLAGGYLAFHHINKSGHNIKLIFKDFNAQFLKRAEGDVLFKCFDGDKIKSMIDSVIKTGERCSKEVNVVAFVPSKLNNEPAAKFKLTLSLK